MSKTVMTNHHIEPRLRIPYWKRYYYDYLANFIAFLVPADAGDSYKVMSDELGRVADVQAHLEKVKQSLPADGRIVITQYNTLWEPILRVASHLRMRVGAIEQNWLSRQDLANLSYLAGLETVKSGTKMIMPLYIPGISELLNEYIANIWPFSKLGLFHYTVLRKPEPRMPIKLGASGHAADAHKDMPSISIVVPARNEAGTIEKIARELPELGKFTEIIFIEGNSRDNTWDEIQRVHKLMGNKRRILIGKQTGKGKGDAVRKGFDIATGDILAIYDADMTVPAAEMSKFYDAMVTNKGDFINGSRLVYPLESEAMRVLNFFGNKFFSLAFTWILGQPLKDTLCGTKVIWRTDYDKVIKGRAFFGDFDPFGDFDLLFGAAKLNLKIVDLPIHYLNRVYGTTNISRWSHGWLLLKMTAFAAGKLKFI